MGTNATERSLIDQWFAYANTTVRPNQAKVLDGIFGSAEITSADWNQAAKDLKAHVKIIAGALDQHKWLVGAEMTCADFMMANTLLSSLQTFIDAGFRKAPAHKSIEPWARAVFDHPSMKKVFGNIQFCGKALKPSLKVEEKKEAPKK